MIEVAKRRPRQHGSPPPARSSWPCASGTSAAAPASRTPGRSSSGPATSNPPGPIPWYGLGMAEAGQADTNYGVGTRLRSIFSGDHLTLAGQAFLQAVELDPSFVPALVQLSEVAPASSSTPIPTGCSTPCGGAADGPAGQAPEFQLALGRLERRQGSMDRALAAFRRYLAQGADRRLGALELTRTELALGDTAARGEYYRLAAGDDPVVERTLRADLSLIAGDSGLAQFDSLRGQARAEFLRRFWTTRDYEDLRPTRRPAGRTLPAPVLRRAVLSPGADPPPPARRRGLSPGRPGVRCPRRGVRPLRRTDREGRGPGGLRRVLALRPVGGGSPVSFCRLPLGGRLQPGRLGARHLRLRCPGGVPGLSLVADLCPHGRRGPRQP